MSDVKTPCTVTISPEEIAEIRRYFGSDVDIAALVHCAIDLYVHGE